MSICVLCTKNIKSIHSNNNITTGHKNHMKKVEDKYDDAGQTVPRQQHPDLDRWSPVKA